MFNFRTSINLLLIWQVEQSPVELDLLGLITCALGWAAHSFLFKEFVNVSLSLIGQNSFPFHWRKLQTLQTSICLPFDNGFPKLDNGSTSTRNTEWVSTYFALLRKQWWNQPSHVYCVVDFRRIQSGREISSFKQIAGTFDNWSTGWRAHAQ